MSDIELIVRGASLIEGWMLESELRWLSAQAAKRRTIIEVGSWKGRSTKALAASTLGIVYAVDHWRGTATERKTSHADAVAFGRERLMATFMANLRNEMTAGRLIMVPYESVEAASRLKDLDVKADMIFIDADHDYESVKRDILLFRELLTPDGLLCGHDFNELWPGVVQAVQELVPNWRGIPETSIWFEETP
jgi:predicted O-methyltransferase YrrM